MLAPAAANSSLDQDVTVKVGLLTPQSGGLSAYLEVLKKLQN